MVMDKLHKAYESGSISASAAREIGGKLGLNPFAISAAMLGGL